MSRPGFPALGFDPTPGESSSVQAVLLSMASAQQAIATTLPRLQDAAKITDSADWGGSAAEEFSDHGDDLPQALGKGGESLGAATKALSTWSGQLMANQAKADELEAKAKKIRKDLEAAEADLESAAAAVPHDTGHPRYRERYDAFLTANEACGRLDDALRKVLDDAERLRAKHLREANSAAAGIRGGPDDAFEPENDSWYVQAFDGTAIAADAVSLATGAAAAGLAATGVGLPAAAVAEGISTASGAVGSVAGLGQQLSGSRNAPGWTSTLLGLGTSVIPGGGTVAAGVRSAGKAAFKRGEKVAARQIAKDMRGALTDGGVPGLVDDARAVREKGLTRKVRRDLIDAGRAAAKKDPDLLERLSKVPTPQRREVWLELGRSERQREGLVSAVDHTQKLAEKAGVELSEEQKDRLALLRVAMNPTGDAVDQAVTDKISGTLSGDK